MYKVQSVKLPIKQLTPNEREVLALLYDKPDWKVLCKLMELEKTQYAEQHVGQLDIGQVRYLTGMVGSLNKLMETIRENFQELNKKG